MFTIEIIVNNGLTARNAVSFVKKANQFHSQIKIRRGNNVVVDAKSILGIMSLSMQKGQSMVIEAQGSDEREAVQALIKVVDGNIHEWNPQGKNANELFKAINPII